MRPHFIFFPVFHSKTDNLSEAQLKEYIETHEGTAQWVYSVGLLAALSQIVSFIVLCTENGGMIEPDTGRLLYISDKLAISYATGYVLIAVFSITLLLFSVCLQDMRERAALRYTTWFLLAAIPAMGVGVVGFHEHASTSSLYGHLVCAGFFITGAISVHMLILTTNSIKWFNTDKILDVLIVLLAASSAIVFLVTYIVSETMDHGPIRVTVATVSASFELALMIQVLTLNLAAPLRVLEHMAHNFFFCKVVRSRVDTTNLLTNYHVCV